MERNRHVKGPDVGKQVSSHTAESKKIPEFKRQVALTMLRGLKEDPQMSQWDEMVKMLEYIKRDYREMLADLEMRTAAWKVIEKLLASKRKDRFEKMTLLEGYFARVPAPSMDATV
jgi:hypothetical protein